MFNFTPKVLVTFSINFPRSTYTNTLYITTVLYSILAQYIQKNLLFQEASFAAPIAPATRRNARNSNAIHQLDTQNSNSSIRFAISCKDSNSKSSSLLETEALENAIVLQSNSVYFESYETEHTSRRTPPKLSASLISHPKVQDAQGNRFAAQSSQGIRAPQSHLASSVPVFDARNEWEARVVRTLITAAASASCASATWDSLNDDSMSRGLLLVRGRYVRQRDVRALLAPRVHPALLDSVLAILLPLHAPTSSLAKLAASGEVSDRFA